MAEFFRTFPVRQVVEHHSGLKSFRFDRVLEVQPGQFILAWLPGIDEKPFAVSGDSPDWLEITVKAVGPFTQAFMNVRAGDRVGLRGPFGRGFRPQDGLVLVGGGIGNAPLRQLAQHLLRARLRFRWVAGARTAADLPFRDDLAGLPECIVLTEDGSAGRTGIVTDVLPEVSRSGPTTALCASGPEGMLLAVRDFARTGGGIPVQLSFERYMKCAVGLCGQCCLDGSGIRVCVEGPVLDEHQIALVTEWGLPHRQASGKRPRG